MNAAHSNAVTVVIPAHNAGQFVGEAIASALAQGPALAEIIVVDDGSADDTAATARACGGDRTRVLSQKQAGPAAARNAGWRAARSPHLFFLDADDAIAPHALDVLLPAIPVVPAAVIPYGSEEVYGPHFADGPVHRAELARHSGNVFRDIALNYRGTIFCALFPRACLEAVNGFNESVCYGEDFDFALRVAQRYEFVRVEAPVYRARMHGGNRHRHFPVEARTAYVGALNRAFANVPAPLALRRRAIAHQHWIHGMSLRAAGKAREARAAFWAAVQAWPLKLDAWRQFLRS